VRPVAAIRHGLCSKENATANNRAQERIAATGILLRILLRVLLWILRGLGSLVCRNLDRYRNRQQRDVDPLRGHRHVVVVVVGGGGGVVVVGGGGGVVVGVVITGDGG